MLNLDKFNKNYQLSFKGISKDIFEESYENGEGDYLHSAECNYLNKVFNISKDDMTSENIQSFILNHLKNEFNYDKIEPEWLYIGENDFLTLNLYEKDNCYSCEVVDDVLKEEQEGNKVYSCRYDFLMYINGIKLDNKDLLKIFPMCNY